MGKQTTDLDSNFVVVNKPLIFSVLSYMQNESFHLPLKFYDLKILKKQAL